MTKHAESATSEETGRRLTEEEKALGAAIYAALRDSSERALVVGAVNDATIDGRFNLEEVARRVGLTKGQAR